MSETSPALSVVEGLIGGDDNVFALRMDIFLLPPELIALVTS